MHCELTTPHHAAPRRAASEIEIENPSLILCFCSKLTHSPRLHHHICLVQGHITPEAQVGGPIALVKNGDPIQIDARLEARTINVMISDEEMEKRRKEWKPPPLRASFGTLYKYIHSVKTASEGCVTDEFGKD